MKDITYLFEPKDIPYPLFTVSMHPYVKLFGPKPLFGSMEGDYIHIHVSDYFDVAPLDVLKEHVSALSNYNYKIDGKVLDYMQSDSFLDIKRPIFLERSRHYTDMYQGQNKNILESVDRVLETGLISKDDIHNASFGWNRNVTSSRWGQCNLYFRSVSINPFMDSPVISNDLLDLAVYHEILHLRQSRMGMFNKRRYHDKQFKEWERQFPDFANLSKKLNHFRINKDYKPFVKVQQVNTTKCPFEHHMSLNDYDNRDLQDITSELDLTGLRYSHAIRVNLGDVRERYYEIGIIPTGADGYIVNVVIDRDLKDAPEDIMERVVEDIIRARNRNLYKENSLVLYYLRRKKRLPVCITRTISDPESSFLAFTNDYQS